jgi:hypothetical protein
MSSSTISIIRIALPERAESFSPGFRVGSGMDFSSSEP